jgi:hypothetical protein
MLIRLSLKAGVRVSRLGLVFLFVTALVGAASSTASAQSVWDQLKVQAKKAKQGATPATQPAAAAKPGQPAAAGKPGQPAADNGTAPFTPPAGTVITPIVVGPYSQGSQFIIADRLTRASTPS